MNPDGSQLSMKTRGTGLKPRNLTNIGSYGIFAVRVADKNVHFRAFLHEDSGFDERGSNAGDQAFRRKRVVH